MDAVYNTHAILMSRTLTNPQDEIPKPVARPSIADSNVANNVQPSITGTKSKAHSIELQPNV